MNNRRASYIGAAVILALGGLVASCSSAGEKGEGLGGTGGSGAGSSGSSGSGAGTGGGSSGSGAGTAGTSAAGAGGVAAECPNAITGNCNTTCAKTDATCTADCNIGCGFNAIGTKHCTCQGGVFIECPCPRPAAFLGPTMAPNCNTALGGDGLIASYKDTPCTTEWQSCIAQDTHTGTPRGCVCMPDPDASNALMWSCGSTNKWFAPQ